MRVLVSVATKHGATEGIAAEIADRLRAAGLEVDVIPASQYPGIAQYEACVIGSAVYLGKWLGDARTLISANIDALRERPVWLFSSGPVGERTDPADGAEGERLLPQIDGRGHRVFAGVINKQDLNLPERLAIRMVKAPYGDYRPWAEIRAWADEIAHELAALPV